VSERCKALRAEGENNMMATKGNSEANIGYSCEQKVLVEGWRKVWSETPGTVSSRAICHPVSADGPCQRMF
jgi:hypothetical protein